MEGRLEETPHTPKDGRTFSIIEIHAQHIRPGVTNEMRRLIRETQHIDEKAQDTGDEVGSES